MDYTDTAGNPATGVVWSPGPLPGTVWVLPESGASTAVVVHVRTRKATTRGWGYDYGPRESDTSKRLAPKDWHAALGFVPAERVQCFEANDAPTLLDLTA
jgi:hypothetical protein